MSLAQGKSISTAPFGGKSKVVTRVSDMMAACSPVVEGFAEILKFVIEPVPPLFACRNLKLPSVDKSD